VGIIGPAIETPPKSRVFVAFAEFENFWWGKTKCHENSRQSPQVAVNSLAVHNTPTGWARQKGRLQLGWE
jgi:hypothetical protein